MKKNRYEVWKQTFSELDFETLRVKSAALGNSLNARHQRPAGRNKPYHSIEDIETRCPSAFFFCVYSSFLLYCRGEQTLINYSPVLNWVGCSIVIFVK